MISFSLVIHLYRFCTLTLSCVPWWQAGLLGCNKDENWCNLSLTTMPPLFCASHSRHMSVRNDWVINWFILIQSFLFYSGCHVKTWVLYRQVALYTLYVLTWHPLSITRKLSSLKHHGYIIELRTIFDNLISLFRRPQWYDHVLTVHVPTSLSIAFLLF